MAMHRVDLTVQWIVSGRVQGVGFRYFTARKARKAGIIGGVRNCYDGTVEIVAQGTSTQLDDLEKAVCSGPANASVVNIRKRSVTLKSVNLDEFDIIF